MSRRADSDHRTHPPAAGHTLLEVVIAIGLLGLVSTGVLAVTGTGIGAWFDTRETLHRNREAANAVVGLHEAIASSVPVPHPDRRSGWVPFFDGTDRSLRLVTSHSPIAGWSAGMRRLTLRTVGDPGELRLILEDSPWTPMPTSGSPPAEPSRSGHSRTLWEGLSGIEFRYLESGGDPLATSAWTDRWHSRPTLPDAVQIEWSRAADGRSETLTILIPAASGRPGEAALWQ